MDLQKARTLSHPLIGGAATVSQLEHAISALCLAIRIGGSLSFVADCRRERASIEDQLASRRKSRTNGAGRRRSKIESTGDRA